MLIAGQQSDPSFALMDALIAELRSVESHAGIRGRTPTRIV
jgi:hypothetical protein